MYYFDSEKPKSSMMGRHFMSSLLWNTDSEQMMRILRMMVSTYKDYGLPINYEALGVYEC
jgi:hypothetical protein